MKIENMIKRLILLFNLCLLILSIQSCGGGTTGTDGGVGMRLAGVLETEDGVRIIGGSITLEETGDHTVSSQNGEFDLLTDLVNSGRLLVEAKINSTSFFARTEVINFNQFTQLDNLRLIVSISNGLVSVEEISVNPVPTPSTSPKPNETPVPEESIILGRIIFADNVPAKGVALSIKGQNATKLSDKNGRFNFKFPVGKESLSLLVKYNLADTIVTLRRLPTYPIEIKINLKLGFNSDDDSVSATASELSLESKFSFKQR
jgi:hypothetical protein